MGNMHTNPAQPPRQTALHGVQAQLKLLLGVRASGDHRPHPCLINHEAVLPRTSSYIRVHIVHLHQKRRSHTRRHLAERVSNLLLIAAEVPQGPVELTRKHPGAAGQHPRYLIHVTAAVGGIHLRLITAHFTVVEGVSPHIQVHEGGVFPRVDSACQSFKTLRVRGGIVAGGLIVALAEGINEPGYECALMAAQLKPAGVAQAQIAFSPQQVNVAKSHRNAQHLIEGARLVGVIGGYCGRQKRQVLTECERSL